MDDLGDLGRCRQGFLGSIPFHCRTLSPVHPHLRLILRWDQTGHCLAALRDDDFFPRSNPRQERTVAVSEVTNGCRLQDAPHLEHMGGLSMGDPVPILGPRSRPHRTAADSLPAQTAKLMPRLHRGRTDSNRGSKDEGHQRQHTHTRRVLGNGCHPMPFRGCREPRPSTHQTQPTGRYQIPDSSFPKYNPAPLRLCGRIPPTPPQPSILNLES